MLPGLCAPTLPAAPQRGWCRLTTLGSCTNILVAATRPGATVLHGLWEPRVASAHRGWLRSLGYSWCFVILCAVPAGLPLHFKP